MDNGLEGFGSSAAAELVAPLIPSRDHWSLRDQLIERESASNDPMSLVNIGDPSSYNELYTKLPDDGWFRVLIIAPGDYHSSITCWLKSFRREDAVNQYEALSYSWNENEEWYIPQSEREAVLIECNNEEVSVNLSLGKALRHLRNPKIPRIMWIDRLCINQDDPEERSQQVQVMSHIYSQASRTIVWLGKYDDTTIYNGLSVICQTINSWDYSQRALFHKIDLDTGETTPCQVTPSEESSSDILDPQSPLSLLFERTWFERRWVIQEIVHSKQIAVMVANYTIPWDYLGMAAAILRVEHNSHAVGVANTYLMFRLRNSDELPSLRLSFLHLIRLTSGFDNSEPKDEVYALLNLSTSDSGPALPIVPIDYTCSMETVYRRLVEQFLTQTSPLSFLENAHGLGYDAATNTSWLPKFHAKHTFRPMLSPWAIDALFAPSRGLEFEASVTPNAEELNVRGIEFATVLWVSPMLNYNWSTNCTIIWDCLKIYAGIAKSTQEILVKMSRTLCAGRNRSSEVESDRAAFVGSFAATLLKWLPEQDDAARSRLNTHLSEAGRGHDADDFIRVAADACPCHALFLTSGGHLGIGRSDTTPGDSVWILAGATLPFVLRKTDKYWNLVGECFIDEVMDGQIVRSMHSGTPFSLDSGTKSCVDHMSMGSMLPPSTMQIWDSWKSLLVQGMKEKYRKLRALTITLR
ncbi:unnamed protein product [Periconia digitata]|uniref:Heterokaryon incompatibility domain-containing protein n=1 Tax=Periconia digitata TaxID=1303443 RepID=A0A9W4U4H2_9PLEO|nr:unnamed protein product [Periconia digitata]